MSLPTSVSHKQNSNNLWTIMAPYIVPPVAASLAIIFAYRDLAAKNDLQKGQPIRSMKLQKCLSGGLKVAPTVGFIVGVQMNLQSIVEKILMRESNIEKLSSTLASAGIVGVASSPFLAVMNGQTMGLSIKESIRKFSLKQGIAISIQETAFVAGLSIADKLAVIMKRRLGNNKAVDYMAAFIAGAIGSLAGHPANTALTRWQSGMRLDSVRQSMLGAGKKAKAIGIFAVAYKFGKEILNSTVNSNKE